MYDITLQEFGSLGAIFQLLADNMLTLDSDLQPGQELVITRSDAGDLRVVEYFRRRSFTLATADTMPPDDEVDPPSGAGIGTMTINDDFIVG